LIWPVLFFLALLLTLSLTVASSIAARFSKGTRRRGRYSEPPR
jgi:hypothetical protein